MPILDDFADARAGDKGDTLIVAIFPRSTQDFRFVVEKLTIENIASHFSTSPKNVTIRVAENIESLVIELKSVLGGGVTGSPTLDGHGKTLSYHMLSLPLSS